MLGPRSPILDLRINSEWTLDFPWIFPGFSPIQGEWWDNFILKTLASLLFLLFVVVAFRISRAKCWIRKWVLKPIWTADVFMSLPKRTYKPQAMTSPCLFFSLPSRGWYCSMIVSTPQNEWTKTGLKKQPFCGSFTARPQWVKNYCPRYSWSRWRKMNHRCGWHAKITFLSIFWIKIQTGSVEELQMGMACVWN